MTARGRSPRTCTAENTRPAITAIRRGRSVPRAGFGAARIVLLPTWSVETTMAWPSATAEHDQWRMIGIYGVGGGVSLLVVVSLFLAFLSMERHTRALDRLTSGLAPSPVATRRAGPDWEG